MALCVRSGVRDPRIRRIILTAPPSGSDQVRSALSSVGLVGRGRAARRGQDLPYAGPRPAIPFARKLLARSKSRRYDAREREGEVDGTRSVAARRPGDPAGRAPSEAQAHGGRLSRGRAGRGWPAAEARFCNGSRPGVAAHTRGTEVGSLHRTPSLAPDPRTRRSGWRRRSKPPAWKDMPRAVVDTTVLISGFLTDQGPAAKLIELASQDACSR